MKGVVVIAASAVALLVAAILGPAAFAGGEPRAGAARVMRGELKGVNFVESCRYSHQAPDDPIVFPGQPGLSHQHTFAGNTSTNAFSSFGSLRSSTTTCRKRADTAAYWVPALYQNGTEILPMGATIYYRRGTTASVHTFPNNLRMIAGDSKAMAPQDLRITYWNCGVEGGVAPSSTVPTCPDTRGAFLRLHVRFPECWDGRNLDSADHKSHMAYATKNVCPATHPISVPQVTEIFRYPTRGGEGFSLSSMGQFSAHADFLNAWNPGALKKLVDDCLNALVHCGQTGS